VAIKEKSYSLLKVLVCSKVRILPIQLNLSKQTSAIVSGINKE